MRLPGPAVVVIDELRPAALFRFDFEAGFAIALQPLGLPDHLHAAGFAGAVLGLTVLLEVAPLPVAALVDVLFVEAHGAWMAGRCVSLFVSGRGEGGSSYWFGRVGVWGCCGGELIGI